ncbi:MAG: hypothetical protein K9J16_12700 [Melioribacteraceae bacterium]|nr:hypothetical protein [Melioribacteraceae bacterium]MCF8356196.1 hypothetical protein [Melioribacteraceae bacterium]MCF8394694.1 hypothetical protein [Melioribacteraceae bacterium]MCF8420228.1 hypothetical protein [Melioribacteraceae bacterium]
MYRIIITLFTLCLIFVSCKTQEKYVEDKTYSGRYLGLTPPGSEPELFAPGFITTSLFTRDIAMMPDGNEIYFSVSAFNYNLIYCTKQVDGKWSEPVPAEFIKDFSYMYFEPFITHDGSKMFFFSTMVDVDSIEGDQDIWVVDRTDDGWGEPYNLGAPINTAGGEYFPSVTVDGTLYFTRQPDGDRNNYIFRSKFVNGRYSEPEKLGQEINFGTARYNAYVDKYERFIIVPAVGLEDSYGGTDYYIVFHDEKDNWSNPINLGSKINTESTREYSASISPDGKYLFFMSARSNPEIDFSKQRFTINKLVEASQGCMNGNPDIYWVSTNFLLKLKPGDF